MVGLLNPGGPIAQFKRNRCSISPVEVILQSGVRISLAALPGHPRSPQGHDGRDIKNRCSAESQQINDHPPHWQRVLCFLASQHRQYAVFSSWSGMGLPAVLTSETSHSRLTRWHLCLEFAFGNTNKKACSNSTFFRERKRAAFPKSPQKSGSKSLG